MIVSRPESAKSLKGDSQETSAKPETATKKPFKLNPEAACFVTLSPNGTPQPEGVQGFEKSTQTAPKTEKAQQEKGPQEPTQIPSLTPKFKFEGPFGGRLPGGKKSFLQSPKQLAALKASFLKANKTPRAETGNLGDSPVTKKHHASTETQQDSGLSNAGDLII